MQISTVGLDLAKNVFQVHDVNRHGKVKLRKQLKRDQVGAFFANLPPLLDRDGGVFRRASLGGASSRRWDIPFG